MEQNQIQQIYNQFLSNTSDFKDTRDCIVTEIKSSGKAIYSFNEYHHAVIFMFVLDT